MTLADLDDRVNALILRAVALIPAVEACSQSAAHNMRVFLHEQENAHFHLGELRAALIALEPFVAASERAMTTLESELKKGDGK